NLYVLAGQVTFTMFSSLVIHGAMLWLGGSFKGSGPIMGPSGVVSLTDKAFCDIYAASTPLPFPLGAVFSTPPTLESAELRVGMTARVEQHENARLILRTNGRIANQGHYYFNGDNQTIRSPRGTTGALFENNGTVRKDTGGGTSKVLVRMETWN